MDPGTRIGPYAITASIGAGGMGEVFRARDTRLNRDVAIKVLPKNFASDAERLRRFEQEVKTLAALNHPNILTIHDAGVHEGAPYLVSELLEGRTLRQEMTGGALPVRKATELALPMAHGLAAAHSQGVIHRDLKPENIFVTKDGRVKILDFGLAKLRENPNAKDGKAKNQPLTEAGTTRINAEAITNSTEPGMVLGTPAYMSPEQVRGESAGHRADIFAFGTVLYEMLSGTRAFRRDTPVASMNAVLNEEPPELSETNTKVSPAIERVVRRCLEKQPERRFQSAEDLAFAIENTSTAIRDQRNPAKSSGKSQRAMALILSFTLLGVIVGFVAAKFQSRLPANPTSGVRYLTHSGRDFSPSASPDGKRICFTSDRDGTNRIWLKDVASASERPLTSGPDDSPRFSPDGSAILFTRMSGLSRSLFRIPAIGGEPFRVVDDVYAGDWSPDGRQVAFIRWEKNSADESASASSSLHLIAVDGSGETLLTQFEGNRRYSYPRWSPDGQKLAVSMHPSQSAPAVAVVTIASKAIQNLKLPGLNAVSSAVWAPDSRRLLYMQPESAGADSSSATARIYQQAAGGEAQQLAWTPAFGRTLEFLPPNKLMFGVRSPRVNLSEISMGAPPQAPGRALTAGNCTDRQPCYSPDGQRVIFSSVRTGNLDVWELNRQSGVIRRLTDDPSDDWDPAFSPDGKHLLFSSSRTGQFEIWMANADGTNPRQITRTGLDSENPAMTPDGAWIVFLVADLQKNGIWKVRSDGTEATQLTRAGYGVPEISPDGQYIAYFRDASADLRALHVLSLQTGKAVPFKISIPIQKETIASLGRLRWMPGGKALAFVGPDEQGVNGVYVQDFVPGQDTSATRRPLGGFNPEHPAESFAISPDGQWLTIAAWEQLFSIMATDALPSF